MAEQPEWITWPQAAELVGCPIPTIDYQQRIGRIESRPHRGQRPTLRRTSVEVFAAWYAEREERYARQRAAPSPDAAPEPAGWITPAQAAQILGRSLGDVRRLVRDGQLDGRRCGRRVWIRKTDVDRVAAERAEWVSIREAANLLGVAPHVAQEWAESGRFERRAGIGRGMPSIRRSSVKQLAAELGVTVGGHA